MVIKVYVAMISCSQEVKKNQQRAVMILESKKVPYTIIDITDPANEDSKDYMVETGVPKEGFKIPVTPQIYNEADYCGDYDGLDMANECDTLGDFLKLSDEEKSAIRIGITGIAPSSTKKDTKESPITNGVSASREISEEKDLSAVPSSEIVENAIESTQPEASEDLPETKDRLEESNEPQQDSASNEEEAETKNSEEDKLEKDDDDEVEDSKDE